MSTAIEAVAVRKRYPLEHAHRRQKRSLSILLRGFPEMRYVQALDGITAHVARGELVGLLGANGSGKSTLLGVLAGVLQPDSGTSSAAGRIVSLLDAKLGFKQELSGEENRQFFGVLLGMTPTEVQATRGKVFRFAGLEGFEDAPMMKYSHGMRERLMLSIALHARPDILLLDEALAEVDEAFKGKCMRALRGLAQQGAAIILVSHELPLISRHCHRALWMEKGRLVMDGDARMVAGKYEERARNG